MLYRLKKKPIQQKTKKNAQYSIIIRKCSHNHNLQYIFYRKYYGKIFFVVYWKNAVSFESASTDNTVNYRNAQHQRWPHNEHSVHRPILRRLCSNHMEAIHATVSGFESPMTTMVSDLWSPVSALWPLLSAVWLCGTFGVIIIQLKLTETLSEKSVEQLTNSPIHTHINVSSSLSVTKYLSHSLSLCIWDCFALQSERMFVGETQKREPGYMERVCLLILTPEYQAFNEKGFGVSNWWYRLYTEEKASVPAHAWLCGSHWAGRRCSVTWRFTSLCF